jgi:hypothetical protein
MMSADHDHGKGKMCQTLWEKQCLESKLSIWSGNFQFRFGNCKQVVFDLESCWASGININPGCCNQGKPINTTCTFTFLAPTTPLGVGVEVDSDEIFRGTGLHRLSLTSDLLLSIATTYTSCIWLHRLTPSMSWYKLVIGLYLMHMATSFDPLCVLV